MLGAGLCTDGSPSNYLRRRLDGAALLCADGTVGRVVVSGDGVLAGHDELAAMRDWLVARGVPAEAILWHLREVPASLKAAWDALSD